MNKKTFLVFLILVFIVAVSSQAIADCGSDCASSCSGSKGKAYEALNPHQKNKKPRCACRFTNLS